MWRGLETTHGSDTEALSTETESKQSRPNLRSIGASPRPYRAPESDGHRLSRCNSNQMHVQPTPHLFLALFTAKIYQLLTLLTAGQFTAHDVLRAFMPPPAQFPACKQALICGPNMRHTRVQSRNRVPVMIATEKGSSPRSDGFYQS